MANEVSGGVEFYVDIDTSKAISSTKAIDTQTKNIEKSFKGVDTQVSKTAKAVNSALKGMGRSQQAKLVFSSSNRCGQIQGGKGMLPCLSNQRI